MHSSGFSTGDKNENPYFSPPLAALRMASGGREDESIMKQFYLVCIISLSICALGVSGVVKTPPNTVIVPNVQGVAVEVAVQMLQTAGLQPKYQTSGSLTALVVQQEPGPGFELPLGGEVRLSCEATGKPSKTMPQTQSQPRTLAIASQSRTSVAPAKVSAVSIKNMATGISVVPIQITTTSSRSGVPIRTTATSSRNVVSSERVSSGQPTILYQPRQPAASKYMIAEPEPRFYPAWYPRRFIPQATTPSAQPPTSLYVVPYFRSSVIEPSVVYESRLRLSGQVGILGYINESSGLQVRYAPPGTIIIVRPEQPYIVISAPRGYRDPF
jgi:hypothetical protein